MDEPSKPFVSTFILMAVSPLITLGSIAVYNFSDVHNTYDFLAPAIGIVQLIFIVGLFIGKLWGLIGYTCTVTGLIIATFAYYVPKGEIIPGIKTSIFLAPLLLLAIYYWTYRRSYFR